MRISKARLGGIVPVLITIVIVMAIVAAGALMLPQVRTLPQVHSTEAPDDPANIAVITGYMPTFGQALRAAGLVDVLKSEGPFTVFAPMEGAFTKMPAGKLEELLKPENQAALQTMLAYHIVPGKIMAADMRGNPRLRTLQGATLEVTTDANGRISVNGARVITADFIVTTNGVIHMVGAVILPPT